MLCCRNMLHVAMRAQSLALAPFVKSFHYNEGDLGAVVERILPNGQAHLMVNLEEDEFRTYGGPNCGTVVRYSGAVLAGPHGRATAIDTTQQRRLVSVEFEMGGAAAFFHMPLSEACNDVVEARDLWRNGGRTLRERLCEAITVQEKFRLLEAFLLKRMIRVSDPPIAAAVGLLERGVPVAEAGGKVNLLPKTFVRRFREQVGLPPKLFSRVRRLQRILGSVCNGEVSWCMIAAQYGYTDQAHLIHDFQDLTGLTPTAYRPWSAHRRNHVPVFTTTR